MHADIVRAKTAVEDIPIDTIQSIRQKFPKNYFGLPPFSLQQTSSALAYQCRKPIESGDYLFSDSLYYGGEGEGEGEEDLLLGGRLGVNLKTSEKIEKNNINNNNSNHSNNNNNNHDDHLGHRKGGNHDSVDHLHNKHDQYAQKKVASALLIMAKNPLMRKHFLSKGGLMAAVVIGLLSSASEMDERLVMQSVVGYIQSLLTHCHRPDAVSHLLLALCNVAPAIMGSDAEVAMRLSFQATKKIDISRSASKALFIADIFNNFSRLNHYSSLLVDEG
eukprot:scaffold3198_cov191-Ochromonas_danica.AAC.1